MSTPRPGHGVRRSASLTNDLSGTTNDLSVTFAYNPASQIIQTVRTGDAYAWTGHGNGSTAYTQNGLNQQITVGGSSTTHDANGNLTTEPQSGKTYGYSSENLLTSATGSVSLGYDPGSRLYQVAGAATTRFAYDGLNAISDYDGSNTLQHRYVFGPDMDDPIVQYDSSGNRSFLSSDERGSIVSLTDSSGGLSAINAYDEYGKPGASNLGRYQYTGQKWIAEAGLYDYKARMYAAQLGRFVQTDPIGYADDPNLYQYALNDPVSLDDPLGLTTGCDANTWVCGSAISRGGGSAQGQNSGSSSNEPDRNGCRGNCKTIYVTAPHIRRRRPIIVPGIPVPIDICPAVRLLGTNGRLRVGGDFGFGVVGFLRGGLGLSLRGDGSLEGDAYLGGGVGLGLFGGGGVGLDNSGGTTQGGNAYTSREVCLSGGYIVTGGACAPSNSVSNPRPSVSRASGGISGGVGLKGGAAISSTKTGNATFRTPGVC